MAGVHVLEDEGNLGKGEGGPVFSPPLYKQRYEAVLTVARRLDPHPKKVVDYGCAECKLLRLLKKEDYIQELVGVDVDSVPLRMNSDLVRPLITDYLHPRPHPLHMSLMQGSIAEPDARLMNFDLLTCIEVVEHLEKPILDRVPQAIFGCLRPKVVVVTTPNSEYNILFPGFSGFRHHDHKFEWTRQQFRTWCDNISNKYGYVVEYGGVGDPPPHKQHVGHCSQLATFTCTDVPMATVDVREACASSPYKLIAEGDHPYQQNPLSADEKLLRECEYYLYVLLKYRQRDLASEDSVVDGSEGCDKGSESGDGEHIALEKLLVFPRVKALCSDVEDIRRVLQSPSSSIQLDQTGDYAVLCVPQQEESEEEIEEEEMKEEEEAAVPPENCDGGPTEVKECWDCD